MESQDRGPGNDMHGIDTVAGADGTGVNGVCVFAQPVSGETTEADAVRQATQKILHP